MKTSSVSLPHLPVRDNRFWFCLSLSLLVGLTLNLLPVTFKVFKEVFGAGYEKQGRTEALFFIGAIMGSVLAGGVTSRRGVRGSVRIGLIAAALGCLSVGSAQHFLMIQAGSLLMGLGSFWLTVIYGTIVAGCFQAVRQRVLAVVNLTMSVAATLAPLGLGVYVSTAWLEWHWPWWIPYVVLAATFAICALCVPSNVSSAFQSVQVEEIRLRVLLRSSALWLIALATILHGLGQMGATVWLARLYEARLGLDESQVGLMISANFFGVVSGRIFWSRFGGRLPDRVLLGCSAAVGSIFYLLTILNHHRETGLFLMYIAGAGMSGDAISLQSYTAFRFRHAASKAFAFTQAVGQVGAAAGPYFIGFVGEQSGSLEQGVWLIPITISILSLLALTWQLKDSLPRREAQSFQ